MPIKQRIRASFGFAQGADAIVISRGQSVVNGITGNPNYPHPPVDPALLKTTLDNFSIAIGNAVNGGLAAKVERANNREAAIKMLRVLSHYVEATCDDDMQKFLSSGFEPLTGTRVPPSPLDVPSIKKVEQGSSGELLVKINPAPKAKSYELRYSALDANGAAESWNSQGIPSIRVPASCDGLKPGTIYVFQVRALGRLGFTDWSHSVSRMVI